MSYTNSPLVTYTKLSPNCNKPRKHEIDTITVHVFVGQVTAEEGCNAKKFVKYNPISGASCNYVVGCDGSIGLCVEEANRAWTSNSRSNDHRAVTIETASETKAPYKVTDKAYTALIELLADICERNGKKKLLWFGDKKKTLAYVPAEDEMVMTVHRWFANKACPGDYLYNKHGAIAEEVTKRLNGGFVPYKIKVTKPPINIRKEPNASAPVVGKISEVGVYTIVEESDPNGTKHPWGKLKSGAGWITLSPSYVKKI